MKLTEPDLNIAILVDWNQRWKLASGLCGNDEKKDSRKLV